MHAQRLVTLITRELSLAQRLAELGSVREFLRDGEGAAATFADLERFRAAFADGSAFLIAHASGDYYFSDSPAAPGPLRPRYTLRRDEPKDAWYYATIAGGRPYALNVNVDETLRVTKVWFNVLVHDGDGGRILGLAGTGLDLTRFLADFVATGEAGATSLIVNGDGVILAHPDPALIEYSALTKASPQRTLQRLVAREDDRAALARTLAELRADPAASRTLEIEFDGRRRIVGAAFVPQLDWYVLSAIDTDAAQVIDENLLWPLALAALALLVLFAAGVSVGANRLILQPLVGLTESARRLAAGDYGLRLHSGRQDELGELTRVFDGMARQIDAHTRELEARVAERTRDLAAARDRIAEAHRQIQDSIRYASLIQHAMLPQEALARALPGAHCVLWQPRDTVGGDLYLFRHDDDGFLLGLIDCAGHGVPGAFMTMIAHAAFDLAVHELGIADPAALLARMDTAIRSLLPEAIAGRQLATNMDAGLCHVDVANGVLRFAGAHLDLYRCVGGRCERIRGGRRSLGERRRGAHPNPTHENQIMPAAGDATYYLSTDGFLDQAGGQHGFGFGASRFAELLATLAAQPMPAQAEALLHTLREHQGPRAQRDDVAVLGFCVPARAASPGQVSGE
ncbi:PPM-type phosphatase domain superfamily protein [Aromatoleum petrolei]|nr:PPM-type phosphatase domain superfamily protein [Aromatoleum petrolei]